MLRTQFLLVCSVLAALGCATPTLVVPLSIEQPQALGPQEGFLLLETDSTFAIERLVLERTDASGGPFEIEAHPAGRHLGLIGLPEGEYRWARVEQRRNLPKLPKGLRYRRDADLVTWDLRDDPDLSFSVQANQVNYPGVLVMIRWDATTMSFLTLNRSGELVGRLLKSSPWLLSDFPIQYSGRMRDDFLSDYQERHRAPGQPDEEVSR